MTNIAVFPIARQARFEPKRLAMKLLYLRQVAADPDRAEALRAEAEAEIGATLAREGVPADHRRAALAASRRDLDDMIDANSGAAQDCEAR
ncbi:MAG: hypothetical protein ACU0AX_02630 [Roseovarius sp.]|uniref:hypothetical protein n=1 Tax=Roseovarius sp. TaxID=1486281 RepID=UPI004058E070